MKRFGIAQQACVSLPWLLLGLACQSEAAGTHRDSARARRVFHVVRAKQLTASMLAQKAA